MFHFFPDKNCAVQLDSEDKLSGFKKEFYIPDHGLIYLDGNSLGRLPQKTIEDLNNTILNEWGRELVKSWKNPWINKASLLGNLIAGIVGAGVGEIVISDSTSVNLFKLVIAALKACPGRKKIVSDELNFPSDLYVLQGVKDLLDKDYYIELIPSTNGISIDQDAAEKLIDSETALVCLSHVAFKTSYMYDMERITRAAHNSGALILWDLCHSAGVVPVDLELSQADLAVGCTYKYLNGGPGSPAFLYVRRNLQKVLKQPVWGWLGSEDPFSFDINYKPSISIERFVSGTPPVISLTAIETGVRMIARAGIKKIRQKSVLQTEYLIYLAKEKLYPLGFSLGSPEKHEYRGSHVSLCHPECYRINQAMISLCIIPDFRAPDSIRLGIAPLYTRFENIYKTIEIMEKIVREKIYKNFSPTKDKVT